MTKTTKTRSIARGRGVVAAAIASSLLVLSGSPAEAATARGAAAKNPSRSVARENAPPFARVYLAMRGCTSCSHCRTTLRQMARSGAKGGEATVADDRVEVRYPRPRTVPLRDVIQSLAGNRLHDMSVVDVLFEATGTLAVGSNGAGRFTIPATGQSFPISVSSAIPRPAGSSVRVVALVDGWRGKGALSLVAREVRAGA
jgi:hypothetical protein